MRGRDEMREIAKGKEIITDLYYNHRGIAYRIVKDVLGDQIDPSEEDDLVQEGFYRMLKCLGNLVDRSKKEYFHYMCATVLHVALDEGRRRSGQKEISFTEILEREELAKLPLYGVHLEDRVVSEEEQREANAILYQALDCLKQQDHDLIVGYYFYEISDRKMGEWLGLKESFVRIYRRRAIKRLSKRYKEVLEQEQRRRREKRR